MCIPQGTYVERRGGAETGQHGEPEVGRGCGPGRHRGGQRAQAEPGQGLGRGHQMPDGARLQRGSVPVLVRIQGPDAASDVEGEGVGRVDVALPGGLGVPGAQELLCVLEVGGIGIFPFAKGAFPKGCVRVDSHH